MNIHDELMKVAQDIRNECSIRLRHGFTEEAAELDIYVGKIESIAKAAQGCDVRFEVASSDKQKQLEDQGCVFMGQEALDSHELDMAKECYCGRPNLHNAAQGEAVFVLSNKNINNLQVDSINTLIARAKRAHITDVRIRINGEYEYYEADWIKHMTASTHSISPVAQVEAEKIGEGSDTGWCSATLYRDIPPGTPVYLAPPADSAQALVDAADKVLVGGNHLASLLIGRMGGGEWPEDGASVREKYGVETYDAWCCWKAIMEFRDAIESRSQHGQE